MSDQSGTPEQTCRHIALEKRGAGVECILCHERVEVTPYKPKREQELEAQLRQAKQQRAAERTFIAAYAKWDAAFAHDEAVSGGPLKPILDAAYALGVAMRERDAAWAALQDAMEAGTDV